jgi:NADH oxidase (H2O-forming)
MSMANEKWKCAICNEVFDGSRPPELCPVCGADSEQFVSIKENHQSQESETGSPEKGLTDNGILIIGNGAAGYYAASTIRKANSDIRIRILSEEEAITYYRPQLTDYLGGEVPEKRFYLSPQGWYKDNNIELTLGATVTELKPETKTVLLSDGTKVPYDRLILANGSSNFIPPVKGRDLEGVFTLKYLKDADNIKEAMKAAKNAVVIGGGLLGLEAAWEMKNEGLNVTVVEFIPRLLPRQLDDEGAKLFKEIADKSDVKLILGDSAEEILSDNAQIRNASDPIDAEYAGKLKKVTAVKLKSGEVIPADLVLFSVGIRPNKALAEKAGITCDKGIIVNERMETSIKDIYACGDVAELKGVIFGNWTAAIEMGKVAGKNALGESAVFQNFVPAVIFKAMNAEVYSAGIVDYNDETLKQLEDKDPEKGIYKKLFFKDDKVIGAILMGDIRKAAKISMAIKAQKTMEEAVREEILG